MKDGPAPSHEGAGPSHIGVHPCLTAGADAGPVAVQLRCGRWLGCCAPSDYEQSCGQVTPVGLVQAITPVKFWQLLSSMFIVAHG